MTGELVLIVDDEINIIDLARLYLEREGYRTESAMDGTEALRLTAELGPSLIILDIMLPGVDGFEVCRRVRTTSDVPIIMLTARDEDIDKIVGLELGADDYLTKPFNPRELVARVKAILRRVDIAPRVDDQPIHIGDVTIDPARRDVTVRDGVVEMRMKEFDVLFALADNKGIVLSREQLLNLVWGYDFYGQTRTVDVHIAQIRKRLSDSETVEIETVTGVGYKLVVQS
ncbi:MAG: response regulator transcription factor [Anaerolineales bacterium]